MSAGRRQCAWRRGFVVAVLYSAFCIHRSAFVFADTLWVSSGGPKPLEYANVTIQGIKDGQLLFVMGGRDAARELDKVVRIFADGDVNLTAGEKALAGQKADAATASYKKVVAASDSKPWAKVWATRRLEQIAGSAPAPVADEALVKLKLSQAGVALDSKQYDKAINDIKTNAALFTQPKDQAQALYILAEASAGIAGSKTPSEPVTWQDAAIAYLRVVAHFKDSPDHPFVTLSLLKAGQIQEKLNDVEAARLLYEQLINQYPTDPTTPTAKAALARLQPKP